MPSAAQLSLIFRAAGIHGRLQITERRGFTGTEEGYFLPNPFIPLRPPAVTVKDWSEAERETISQRVIFTTQNIRGLHVYCQGSDWRFTKI